MHAVLAVDAGGTKCEALLVAPDGRLLGWGLCRPEDPQAGSSWGGRGRSVESALAAVRRALGQTTPDSLTVSGLGRWDVPELMARVSPAAVTVVPVAEWDAPLALAGVDHGLVVLAGTGAFVFGLRADGRQLHLDGLGPMLGDYGSGSMIGHLALRAVARANWHPRHQTRLTRDVAEVLGIDVDRDGVGKLVYYAHEPRDRAEVARLAVRVDAAAVAGDAVALSILHQAADAQAEVIRDAVEALELTDAPTTMVAAGSVATRSTLYWSRLCERVAVFAPLLKPVVPAWPQVVGTALRALAIAGEGAYRERLLADLGSAQAISEG